MNAKKKNSVVRHILDGMKLVVIPVVAYLLIRIIRLTMRITYLNKVHIDALHRSRRNYILTFWHGRLFMMLYAYPGKKITVLISRHRDGEFIARTMKLFGYDSTRGSTTSGGFEAMKEILHKAKSGYDIAFTPDGPRGPGQKAQPGVIQIAKFTGLPIIPASFSASRRKVFASWDRFLVPIPFSRGVFIYGDPIFVEKNPDLDYAEEKRVHLEEILNRITDQADRYFG